jgi:hypothetical protein
MSFSKSSKLKSLIPKDKLAYLLLPIYYSLIAKSSLNFSMSLIGGSYVGCTFFSFFGEI